MTEAPLRKRDREPEVLPDHNDVQLQKRVHGEENNRFLHLLQFHETFADDEEETFAPNEELVNRFMRSLEKEIAPTCSSSYFSSNSGDNLAATDISRGHEGETIASDSGFDLCYLLEASDDELGIPPNPVLDMKDEDGLSTKETFKDLLASLDLKFLGENWHFEDDLQNYQHIAVYDDPWIASQLQNYMNRDFVSQSMLFNSDFSAA
jgi:hypothetical protein